MDRHKFLRKMAAVMLAAVMVLSSFSRCFTNVYASGSISADQMINTESCDTASENSVS